MSSPLDSAKNTNSMCWAPFVPPFPDYRISVKSSEATISESVELFYLPKQAQDGNSMAHLHQLENLSTSNYEEDSAGQMTTKGEEIHTLLSRLTLDDRRTVSAFNVSDCQPQKISRGIFDVPVLSAKLASVDQSMLPLISQSDPPRNVPIKFYLPKQQDKKKVGRPENAKTKLRHQPYDRKARSRTIKNPNPEVKSTAPRGASVFNTSAPISLPPGRTTFPPPMNPPTSFIPFERVAGAASLAPSLAAPFLGPIAASTVNPSTPVAVAAKKQEKKRVGRPKGAKTKHRRKPYNSKARSRKSTRTSYPVVKSTTTQGASVSEPPVSDPFSISSRGTTSLLSMAAPNSIVPSDPVAVAAPLSASAAVAKKQEKNIGRPKNAKTKHRLEPYNSQARLQKSPRSSYPVVESTTTRGASVSDPLVSDPFSLSSSRTTFIPSVLAPNSFIPSKPVAAAAPLLAPAAVVKKQENNVEHPKGAKTKHRYEPYNSKARLQTSTGTSYPVVESTFFPSMVAPNSFHAPVPVAAAAVLSARFARFAVTPSIALVATAAPSPALLAAAPSLSLVTAAAPSSALVTAAPSSALVTAAAPSSALVTAASISAPVDALPYNWIPPILSSSAPENVKARSKISALACIFCRGRKIACGPLGPDETCQQCKRRGLVCSFPEASQRGLKKKPATSNEDSAKPKAAAGKDAKTH